MDNRVLKRKGVAGTLAIALGTGFLAWGSYGPGAALFVAGVIDLAIDGLTLLARRACRQFKSRRAT